MGGGDVHHPELLVCVCGGVNICIIKFLDRGVDYCKETSYKGKVCFLWCILEIFKIECAYYMVCLELFYFYFKRKQTGIAPPTK